MMKNKFSVRLIARLYRLLRKEPVKKTARILIVSTTGLGDTLWSLPAARSLRRSFPTAKIFLLTGRFGKELFDGIGMDQIIEVPIERGWKRIKALLQLNKKLKSLHLDTVLFFHVQPTYALLGLLTGARTYGNPEKVPPSTLMDKVPFTHATEHLIAHRLRMIELIGARPYYNSLHLDTDQEITQGLKSRYQANSAERIGFCIGSQDAYKIWSPEQFARLANRLKEVCGASVLLIGSAGEKGLAKRVLAVAPNATDLTGAFSIKELIHFIDGLDLLISNDTGPAHIAYAVGCPCITLFSPTDSEQNGPYYAKNLTSVVSQPMTCSPCITTHCHQPICMKTIPVELVVKETLSMLGQVC